VPVCRGRRPAAGGRARAAARAMRRGRCGGSDVVGRRRCGSQSSQRGPARYGTHRTQLILAGLRRRGGLWGGDAPEASLPLD